MALRALLTGPDIVGEVGDMLDQTTLAENVSVLGRDIDSTSGRQPARTY